MKGFQFRKSFQLLPGVRLNISKKGASLSLGPDDAHITTGTSGTYFYLDLPGSGAYYRRKLDGPNKESDDKNGGNVQGATVPEKLDLGFWQRLTIPPDELSLVEALKALSEGDEDKALEQARSAVHLADGAFLAGFLLFKRGEFDGAAVAFNQALKAGDQLGTHAEKYELDLAVQLPITDEISVRIEPSVEGVLLALAECHQNLGLTELAIENLQELHRRHPDDLVVRLSLAEALSEAYPDSQPVQQRIVALAEGVHNASPVHAALMYYRARALRYERALIYEMTGEQKKARAEFQKIYAESPTYEDVAARLGL